MAGETLVFLESERTHAGLNVKPVQKHTGLRYTLQVGAERRTVTQRCSRFADLSLHPLYVSVFAYGEAANVFDISKVVHRDCFFYISEVYVDAEAGSSLRVSGRRERLYRASLRRRPIRA